MVIRIYSFGQAHLKNMNWIHKYWISDETEFWKGGEGRKKEQVKNVEKALGPVIIRPAQRKTGRETADFSLATATFSAEGDDRLAGIHDFSWGREKAIFTPGARIFHKFYRYPDRSRIPDAWSSGETLTLWCRKKDLYFP